MSLAARLLLVPSWLLLILLIVITVGLSLLGLRLVNRRVPHHVMKCHNDVAGFIFATIGVMYGVILGFDIYMVWQDFNDAQKTVALESGEVLGLYRDLDLYPDEQAVQGVRTALIDYLHSVVHDEFPAMARMQRSPATRQAIDRIWENLRKLHPRDDQERLVYKEILEDMNRMAKFRLERLSAAEEELPNVVWLALIVGAVITISFTFFFGSENTWAQVTMTALLAAMVATVIFVILQLDHPFMGEVCIKPDPYVRELEYMATPR